MGTSLLWQTDTQLHDSVQRQLEWDPEIDASDIAVIASDGVVTLTGFVHSYAAKLAAERSVKRVRGVRAVANDIQVTLLGERTDPDIGADDSTPAHVGGGRFLRPAIESAAALSQRPDRFDAALLLVRGFRLRAVAPALLRARAPPSRVRECPSLT